MQELKVNEIYNIDCLKGMKYIQDKSIDMIICDLPYGVLRLEWDNVIPIKELWSQYNRIIKDNGVIALFGKEPFSSYLRINNISMYRYDFIWVKQKGSDIGNCNVKPMNYHEVISIFYKNKPCYNQQYIPRISNRVKQAQKNNYKGFRNSSVTFAGKGLNNNSINFQKYSPDFKRLGSVIECPSVVSNSKEKVSHPTQKPIALIEILIKTYSNENDLILDNCLGSGTTACACLKTRRNYIGFEIEKNFYNIALNRIKKEKTKLYE
ncbi:MAG: site-specific DNA-methyltransferase [Leptospirales bacterium]|nr:site-specific DNA-methyltransferase [Leptospirales bacterium]